MAKRKPVEARPPVVGTNDGRMPDEQARIIRAELERVAGNPDLVGLTTEAVVEAAKDPTSPLHGYFTWNVQEAAEKYWAVEARRLISSVRYVIVSQDTNEPIRVRSIVSAKIVNQNDEPVEFNGWIDRKALLRKQETRVRFIQRARQELLSWTHRYCDVDELRELRQLIREALDVE